MRAYLDHAATTGMLEVARIAMLEQFNHVGNASSVHADGRAARRVAEDARDTLAHALGVDPNEVIFTSGGTESDNAAVKGTYWARHQADPRRVRVLVGATEHHAVLDAAAALRSLSAAQVTLLPVDGQGFLDLDALAGELASDPGTVALVAVMLANNEVGTVAPIAAVADLCARYEVPLHVDAVQAFGAIPVSPVGASTMALSAHKLGGPVGVGALWVSRSAQPVPLVHGGGQERSLRSGTLNVAGMAAMAAAADHARRHRAETFDRLVSLRTRLVAGVAEIAPEATCNGPAQAGPAQSPKRLPGLAHFTFPGCRGESMLMVFDAAGVSVSTGSACSAGVAEPSHVLAAMGQPRELARSNLRVSLGHSSTADDVDRFLEVLPTAIARARARRAASASGT